MTFDDFLGNHETQGAWYIYFTQTVWRIVWVFFLFNGLEPLKPLVIKLQKRKSDLYQSNQAVVQVIEDLKYVRENIDHEFDHWYSMAQKILVMTLSHIGEEV